MRHLKAGLVLALVACGTVSLAIGCSSSSDTSTGGSDASTGGGDGSGGGDGGGGGEGGHGGGTVIDSGGATSGFGAACTGPDGTTGGCTDSVYNLCSTVGPSLVCTKACTYPGGGGAQPDPTDCPNPPTSGDCTPRGFCK